MRNFAHMKFINIIKGKCSQTNIYKGHIRESDNVALMNSCPLYRG